MDQKRKALLNIAHLNVRSLISHFDDIRDIMITNDFDVFCLSETWLSDRIPNALLAIDGFKFIRADRGSRGGGVGIYLKNNINFKLLKFNVEIEQIVLSLEFGGLRVVVCTLYRPPSYDYKLFMDRFESLISDMIMSADYVLCLGDFNMNFLDKTRVEIKLLMRVLESFGLVQMVEEATRTTINSITLIDYMLTTAPDSVQKCAVLPVSQISDHDLVHCIFNLPFRKPGPIFKTSRDFKNLNYSQFKCDLMSIPWDNIYDQATIDDKVHILSSNIITLLDLHAPFKTIKISKNYSPWLTDTLRDMIRTRNQLLSKFKRSGEIVDWNVYKQLRNSINTAIKKEKRAYYDKYTNQTGNLKTSWAYLKRMGIINNNGKNTDLSSTFGNVDRVNEHFLNSVPDLPPDNDLLSFYANHNNCIVTSKFKFRTVDEIEVLESIKSIKSRSIGCDGINILTIQLCVPHILPHITHIINFCLLHSVFPKQWKKAVVIPIPKVSNPKDLNNLRPISILPTLSKILEKIICKQIWSHLNSNKIIPPTQSGFRKNHGCTTALLHITDDVIRATDQGKLTLLTLLDYSKAFDCLNHKLFETILVHLGFCQDSILLLSSYLTERFQAVFCDGKMSSFLGILRGVPQGSILGPILFIMYISQFLRFISSCSMHNYADDSQLYISFFLDESAQAIAALNFDLNIIYDISTKHCLQLNKNKTVAMLFGRRGDRIKFLEEGNAIKVGSDVVRMCDKVKNLGVWIDVDLRFTDHVSACLQKAYGMLRVLYRNRKALNHKVKVLLCESVVLSHLNYADCVYGPCLNFFDKQRVQKLQNSCLRLIFGIRKFERISHTLRVVDWLNMERRRSLHASLLFMKLLINRTPPYLYNKITFRSDVHNLNIRFKGTLTPPVFTTQLFRRSFSYYITLCINSLSVDIRGVSNIRRLRALIFSKLKDEQMAILSV